MEVQGHVIPAYTKFCINPRVNHMMNEYWDNPKEFRPERFIDNDTNKIVKPKPWTWIPYGGGPHMCLGMYIADFQIKSFLIHLIGKYQIRYSGDINGVAFQQIPFIKPKNDLPITLFGRRNQKEK